MKSSEQFPTRKAQLKQSESAEAIKDPVIIAYRDNDLFAEFVPRITQILERRGRAVSLQTFPRGSNVRTESNQSELIKIAKISLFGSPTDISGKTDRHIGILDRTLRTSLNLPELERKTTSSPGFELDAIIGDIITKHFCGELYSHDQMRSPEGAKSLFQKTATTLAEKLGKPDHIVVDVRKITEHWPFIGADEQYAFQQISSWVREIFPECAVEPGENPRDSGWFIVDRHQSTIPAGIEPLIFRLPVESGIHDLAALGLLPALNISNEEIEERLDILRL